MGSVMSDTECPFCKFEFAFCDYYYKTGEEYIYCDRCGSSVRIEIVNRPDEAYPDDWKPRFERTEEKKQHSFKLGENEEGIKSCGGLVKKDLKEFIKFVKDSPHIKYAFYTYKYGGEWFSKNIITGEKKPFVSPYEEQFKEVV